MKKKPTKYILFTERNDWEGETWNFFIPIKGNEEAINRARDLLAGQTTYSISDEVFSEAEAKKLERAASGTTYMNEFTIAKGFQELPEYIDFETQDPFYKAGLIEFGEADDS